MKGKEILPDKGKEILPDPVKKTYQVKDNIKENNIKENTNIEDNELSSQKPKIDYKSFESKYKDMFKQKTGEEPHIAFSRDRAIIKSIVNQYGMEKVLKMLDLYFENTYAESKGFTIPIFKYNINSLVMEIKESNVEVKEDPIIDYIRNRICRYLKNEKRFPVVKMAADKMLKNAHSIIKLLVEKDNPVLVLASFAWAAKNDFWKDKLSFSNLETIGNQFVIEKDQGEYLEIYKKEMETEFGEERIRQCCKN